MDPPEVSPEAYCRTKVAGSGSSFYYSFSFLTPERRRAITALYAFCREVDDVVDECTDSAIAGAKLDWWRAEIERLFSGQPQHPTMRALAPHLQVYHFSRVYFLELIDGMQMDLEGRSYASFAELQVYCHRVAGVVGLMSAGIFGFRNRETLEYAENLGIALQLINIIRDVREDVARGRIYLPGDELEQCGVSPQDLHASQTSERVKVLLKLQADRAREYHSRALSLLPAIDRRAQLGGLIMAAIYMALLKEIEDDGFRVLEHRVRLTPLRKLWIAWRTSRREKAQAA
jgi:phytoene synthase